MPEQDYTQDKGFMAASPEDQHAYLMHADKGYAGASPQDQKAFIAHIRGQAGTSDAAQTGAFQTEKGGKIYTDPAKSAADQENADKAGAEITEKAMSGNTPGGEAGVGAVKGAMSTARNLGGLGIKAIRAIAPRWGDKLASAWPEALRGANETMKPQSIPAKIGFGGEQAAEFAIPGGAVTKGTKALDVAADAAKLAPWATKALKLGWRGALEAGSTAAITKAQGGDVGTNATIAGAMPFASAALKPAFTALAEKAAPALANKLLRPVPMQVENAMRFGRNPGQALADEGIVATSHGDLVSRIADRKEDVGRKIGTMLQAAKGQFPNAPSLLKIDAGGIINKHIDDAIKEVANGGMEGGQALIDRLEEMRAQLTQNREIVGGKLSPGSAKNMLLNPDEAHTLKRQIGDSAKWTGQAFDGEMNQVKRAIYRDLNGEVQKAVPSVKALQERYGNLLEAEKAAEREFARHESRNPFGMLDAITGGAGAAIGGAHGGPKEAALLAMALPAARKAMQSPLAQTAGVQALKNSPKLLNPEFLRFARNAAFGAHSENRQ